MFSRLWRQIAPIQVLAARRRPIALAGRPAAALIVALLLGLVMPASTAAQQVRLDATGISGVEANPESAESASSTHSKVPDPTAPLGRYALLLDEDPEQPLSLADARQRLAAGDFVRSRVEVPNLGDHAPPRWLHLEINNTQPKAIDYRIYVAEGWTDRVDAWLLNRNGVYLQWQGGDERSPDRDLRAGLGFAFDAALQPGVSELFVRVDSVDSVALALRVVPLADAGRLEGSAQNWLGLVHGFLLALVVTYGLLWLALRETSLLRYVAYVGSYLYMHLSYSGNAAHALWPESPAIGRFAILIGMTLFSSAGITFARDFLRVAEWAPRVDRVLAWLVRLALAAMALCVVSNAQGPAVSIAFSYIMLFTVLMVVLGILGVRKHQEQARMFLIAASISMAGALITTLAVMGKLPFNDMTFRLIEVGVMLEATIWALALGLRLRRDRDDRVHALQLARHDALTGLFNRRGFMERALPAFIGSSEGSAAPALIMLDIDHFKAVNDQFGHDAGDRSLVAVSNRLRVLSRDEDIIARWGGEEFVILLPDTGRDEAVAIAERLRLSLVDMSVALSNGGSVNVTASMGVAMSTANDELDDLLRKADNALYEAKQAGRNRVESSG